MEQIDRALLSASEVLRDFSGSKVASRLTPMQLLTTLAIASFENATNQGLAPGRVSDKLREIADAFERL